MNTPADPLQLPAFWAVLASWFVFAAAFVARKRPPAARQRVRSNASVIGSVLVGVGYAIVWGIRRRAGTPIAGLGPMVTYALDACRARVPALLPGVC